MKYWWAAHIVMYAKFRDGNQDYYPIMENVHLVRAASREEAIEKAEKIGKECEIDVDGTYCDDRPAVYAYAGLRKVLLCDDSTKRPGDGTEVTYSEFIIEKEDSFLALLREEDVMVEYQGPPNEPDETDTQAR